MIKIQVDKYAVALIAMSAASSAFPKDDIGVSDYAKAHWNPGKSCVPLVRKYESVCGSSFLGDFSGPEASSGKYDNRADKNVCSNLPAEDRPAVQKGQVFSINLQQSFISEFREWTGPFSKKGKGEVAVVARVAEMNEASDFDFSQAGRDRARLVYYSEGVSPKQFLNFSQLPVYGPIEYGGKPLLIELYILELDVKENSEISGLLAAAAGLGSVAYPPASPILQVLDTIGSGLLKAKKSDTEFKYHASLVSAERIIPSIAAGLLEFGTYAFVRMPEPEADVTGVRAHPWSQWTLNQKNGRIYSDAHCSSPLVEHTYLTFQINRASEEASLDRNNTLLKLQSELQGEARSNVEAQKRVIDDLKAVVEKDKSYQDAKRLISYAASLRFPGSGVQPSELSNDVKTALGKIIADVKASLNGGSSAVYQRVQAETLVGQLGRLIGYTTIPLSPLAFDPNAVKTELKIP